MSQQCQDLSREDAAQLEARVLARLLATDTQAGEVAIACDRGIAVVTASSGDSEVRRSVSLSGPVGRDQIMALVERAVTELVSQTESRSAPAATPSAGSNSGPADSSLPSLAPLVPTPVPASAAPSSGPTIVECTPAPALAKAQPASLVGGGRVRVELSVENWGSRCAGGARLGLEQRAGVFSYAFLGGTTRLFNERSFAATEWTFAGDMGWQPPSLRGFRWSGRLGLSLLSVTPGDGVSALSSTLKSAAFFELDLSRPVWFGRFALAPGLGIRAFSARRAVDVDGQRALRLTTPSISAVISALLRVGD